MGADYCYEDFYRLRYQRFALFMIKQKHPHLDFNDIDFEELLGMEEEVMPIKAIEDVIPSMPEFVEIPVGPTRYLECLWH